MRKSTLAALAALFLSLAGSTPAGAQDTRITTPPGTPTAYYFDNSKFDVNGVFGFSWESHKEKNIYVDGNDYYIPNFIWPGVTITQTYVKGTLQGDTIVVPNHQMIYYYASEEDTTRAYLCWANDYGEAGDSATNTPFADPIKFVVEGNTISCIDGQMLFGMYDDSICYPYGYSEIPSFINKKDVDDSAQKYNLSYVYVTDNNNDSTALVTIDNEGGIVYIKGLDPKYPEQWFIGVEADSVGSLYLPSNQIANTYDEAGDVWMYATNANASLFLPYNGFYLVYNPDSSTYSTPDSIAIANIGINISSGTIETYQKFKSLVLTPTQLKSVTPATPSVNLSRVFRVDSNNNPNFTVSIPAKDVDGNDIDPAGLTYRIYINGEPYTFRKSTYTFMSVDSLTDIPYNYDDYYNISKSGATYYITFRGITKDEIQTIGVELVYNVNGQETVSKRLVYNVQDNTSAVVDGINSISKAALKDAPAYNVQGQRVGASFHGILIKNGKKYIRK